jgi:uncharacterized protein (UPF0335 family)
MDMLEPLVNIFETDPEFGVHILVVIVGIGISLGGYCLWLLDQREKINKGKISDLKDQIENLEKNIGGLQQDIEDLEKDRKEILGGDEKSIRSYASLLKRLADEAEILLEEYKHTVSGSHNLEKIVQEIKRLSSDIDVKFSNIEASQIIEARKADWTRKAIQPAGEERVDNRKKAKKNKMKRIR